MRNAANIIRGFALTAVIVTAIVLAISIFWSGYTYQLDNDEVFHVNILYQMAHGQRPYTDFFTIYTPVFHYLLMPIYYVFGPTFTTFSAIRVLMIILYLVRIGLTVSLLSRVFGRVTAWIFIPLIVLDPLTSFTSFQIRPDNIMLLAIIIGFLLLEAALRKNRGLTYFLSGLSFGIAAILLVKSLPVVATVSAAVVLKAMGIKDRTKLLNFFWGVMSPIVLFTLYFALRGELTPMIRGIVLDPLVLFNSLLFPSTWKFYYQPDNWLFFGTSGKPLTWYYAVSLPWAGLIGAAWVLVQVVRERKFRVIPLALFGCAAIQAIVLYKSPSVFSQYFLAFNWFVAIFAAIALARIYSIGQKVGTGLVLFFVGAALFVLIAQTSFKGNMNRATITGAELKEHYKQIWAQIPPNEPTFPNFLFRPSVYPLLIGSFYGDVPPQILARFPDIVTAIETHRVNYLILSDYYVSFLPPYVQTYIHEHFALTQIPEVYKRVR